MIDIDRKELTPFGKKAIWSTGNPLAEHATGA
jgi:hypothetical protein